MKVQGPELRDRALEIGIAGAATRVSGATTGAATLHLGTFRHGRVWLLAAELEPSFAHVPGSNLMDLEAAVSWFHPAAGTSAYGFFGFGGGLREQWTVGVRERRYPMGGNAGALFLISDRAGVRAEYRYRRVLDPSGTDHNEQRLQIGLSLFARNAAKAWIR